jgi:hypothetical protein
MQRLQVELIVGLGRHEAHVLVGHRFGDGFSIDKGGGRGQTVNALIQVHAYRPTPCGIALPGIAIPAARGKVHSGQVPSGVV